MGCDIHISLEIRRAGVWEPANTYYKHEEEFRILEVWEGRNYELFSQLCGVRGTSDCHKISEPKDFPLNCSKETLDFLDEPGYHSHSWNNLVELRNFGTDHMGWMIQSIEAQLEKLMLWSWIRPENGNDVRIVYAFDN